MAVYNLYGMKRTSTLFVVLVVLAAVATVALIYGPSHPAAASQGRLNIVCTFLPMYVFAQNVIGDVPGINLELLIDRDLGCPHSYSLTGQDLKKISRADVIVANGLGVEPFLERVRSQTKAQVITISDDCDVLRLSAEEAQEEKEEHEHANEAAAHDHGDDINPHTWVSPRQAAKQVRTLARKLGEIDHEHAEAYRINGENYAARLEAIADQMEQAAHEFTNRNIVTGHAAFDYLARDLKLNVVATLHIVPGETGSAAEMARIIEKIRDSHAAAVFQEPPFSDRMATTIARDAGVPIEPLNPFNSDAGLPPPKTPQEARQLYETAMLQNLATLKKALSTPTTQNATME